MSDFLAEMEARRTRAEAPTAPVAAIVIVFIVAFFGSLIAGAIGGEGLSRVIEGLLAPATHYLRMAGGTAVFIGVLVGILFLAGLFRRRPRWTLPVVGGVAAIVLVLTFSFSAVVGPGLYNHRQERIARAEIAAAMDRMLGQDLDDPLIDPRPKARGDAGKLEGAVKQSLAALQKLGRAYTADLYAMDLQWRDGAAHLTPAALRRRVERLTAAKARTEQFRAAMVAEMRGLPDRLEKSGISKGLLRSFVEGFEDSIDRDIGQLNDLLDVHLKMIDVHLAQTRFLIDRPNAWVSTGGRIAFYRTSDVTAFNAFADDLGALEQEAEELQYQSRKRMVDGRDRIAGEY